MGRNMALSVASGVLLGLCFPDFSQGWLAWFALVPLLVVALRTPPGRATLYGFAAGVSFFGILLFWLLSLEMWVGWGLAILAWAALSIVQATTLAVFAGAASYVLRTSGSWGRQFAVPAVWMGLELFRSVGPWAFSWGVLGSSQTSVLPLLQPARLIGVFGVSYLIVLFNAVVLEFVRAEPEARRFTPSSIAGFALVAAAVLAGVLGGPAVEPQPVKVGVVQGNVAQEDKWLAGNLAEISSKYFGASEQMADDGPELIVWPETALPVRLNRNRELLARVHELSQDTGASLLVGGSFEDGRRRQYNSVYFFTPDVGLRDRYDKIKLVLFGEYVPPWPLFGSMKTVAGLGDSLTAGRRISRFETAGGTLAAAVCFESSDPFLNRMMVDNGARLLVVVTNDAWFGRTAAPAQHLDLLRVRAVENGVFAVQAANTGFSALVGARGQVLSRSSLFTEETLVGDVRFASRASFYSRIGYLLPVVGAVAGAAYLLLVFCSRTFARR
ncbi:MAG: apolipoprotein N-acyltransferase [Terriglobia bacterium]